jgi:hypothetical protein
MFTVSLRPSSHSTDYTVIGNCKNVKVAKKLAAAVKGVIAKAGLDDDIDWELPETLIMQNRVLFTAHTGSNASLDGINETMAKFAESVETHEYYQELEIELLLPGKTTLKTLPLIVSSTEALLVRKLEEFCGEPEITRKQKNVAFTFKYRGSAIYDIKRNRFYSDRINNAQELPDYWRITVPYSAFRRWDAPQM